MVLPVNGGSPERGFKKRQPLQNGECGFPDFSILHKRVKVSCIRDFPKGCGPCGRPTKAVVNSVDVLEDETVDPLENVGESLVPEVLEDLDQSKLIDESDDSGSEMVKKRQPLQNGECGFPDSLIKYKRVKVSCIRNFPKGCRRLTEAVVNSVDVLEDDSVEPLKNVGESLVPEVLEDLDQSKFVDESDDSGSEMVEETTMVSFDNEEEALESDYLGSEMVEETTMVSSDDEEEFDLGSEMVEKTTMVSSDDEEEAVESDYLGPEMVEETTMVSSDDEEEFDLGYEMVEETTMVSSDDEAIMVSSDDEGEALESNDLGFEMVSNDDEEEAFELVEPVGIELSKHLDYAEFADSLETLENETPKLLQKDLVGIQPKIYLPRGRVSAIRDFPAGCGSCISHVSQQNEVKQDKEGVQDEDLCKSKLNGMSSEEILDDIQAQSEGDGNQLGTTKEKSNFSLKQTKSPKKVIKRDVSCLHGKMNQMQGEKPIDYRVGRVIVQGLMAAPNCPWRQSKRSFKSSSTSGMARGK